MSSRAASVESVECPAGWGLGLLHSEGECEGVEGVEGIEGIEGVGEGAKRAGVPGGVLVAPGAGADVGVGVGSGWHRIDGGDNRVSKKSCPLLHRRIPSAVGV